MWGLYSFFLEMSCRRLASSFVGLLLTIVHLLIMTTLRIFWIFCGDAVFSILFVVGLSFWLAEVVNAIMLLCDCFDVMRSRLWSLLLLLVVCVANKYIDALEFGFSFFCSLLLLLLSFF